MCLYQTGSSSHSALLTLIAGSNLTNVAHNLILHSIEVFFMETE